MDATKTLLVFLVFALAMRFEAEAGPVASDLSLSEYDEELVAPLDRRGSPEGCHNANSEAFCKRFKSYCVPGNRNFNYLKEKCAWTCGCK
ncbi:antimicrobial peptide damicornin-like [Porites lutea]|uniref:antimicrobial peptide damicornin-like n=1 Tax=Porites lutea TaxID=51062 RepID=UPI003CC6BCB5